MLLLLRSNSTSQGGFRSYFLWNYGGMGGVPSTPSTQTWFDMMAVLP